ncbi:hypothetical protein [Jannaschia pagri]|uniref:hypothetical protein n=1 Tax=Jannaschia TaxID=188905 RepID=UPI00357132A5
MPRDDDGMQRAVRTLRDQVTAFAWVMGIFLEIVPLSHPRNRLRLTRLLLNRRLVASIYLLWHHGLIPIKKGAPWDALRCLVVGAGIPRHGLSSCSTAGTRPGAACARRSKLPPT